MQVNVYAIHDSKAQAYLQPFFSPTHAVAFRNLENAMRNPQSPFAQFPGDFTLFRIASFEDTTGILEPLKAHENLGNLIQFKPSDSAPAALADTKAA